MSGTTGEEIHFTAEDIINTLDREGAFDIFGPDRSYNENFAMWEFPVDRFTPGWMIDAYGVDDEATGSRYLPINVLPVIFRGPEVENLYFDGDRLEDYVNPFMESVRYMQTIWAMSTRNKVRLNIITLER